MMKLAVRSTAAALTALATAGVGSLFAGAAPAQAAEGDACGPGATLLAPDTCEQVFTGGTTTFTPSATATKLEALLVGGGGSGAAYGNGTGYGAAGGGGGEVKVVDVTTGAAPITVNVGGSAQASSIVSGAFTSSAASGVAGVAGNEVATGGASGNGNAGASTPAGSNYAAGAGAGGSPSVQQNGGAGLVVGDVAAVGSLFAGDTRCVGGGGAVGTISGSIVGTAACGGSAQTPGDATQLSAAVANSGGGGGATIGDAATSRFGTSSAGASGVVVLRWRLAPVTVTFDANGHGAAPAAETVSYGTAAAEPSAPSATGWVFGGWFTDATLATPVDFAAPLTASTTYFAKWTAGPVSGTPTAVDPAAAVSDGDAVGADRLPDTGVEVSGAAIVTALSALVLGLGLVTVARVRRRRQQF
ncbi:InlB B-repeat-containing protein [Schumannella soli]|uniref:InlB B-repeat-containing protein n=1 Tax=Schumannella soli TaxID=2590779 RepID=A0A506XNM2_9MICO|nr:InlB B-repeat-containing protein [Schumannella soli]TPW74264.1 InlB B-repeat-containing protein [Schumannella soli]